MQSKNRDVGADDQSGSRPEERAAPVAHPSETPRASRWPSSSPHSRLVIVERGSRWPRALTLPGRPDDETLVIGQRESESSIDLARRVLGTLAGISTFERPLESAVLFVGTKLDDRAMTARHVMARGLLRALLPAGDLAELVLVADGAGYPELRHAILSLVEILVVAPGASPVPVRACFDACDDAPTAAVRESGLRLRAVTGPAEGPREARTSGGFAAWWRRTS